MATFVGIRTLYSNLGRDEGLALALNDAIQASRMDGWRDHAMKAKRVRLAIKAVLQQDVAAKEAASVTRDGDNSNEYDIEVEATRILELARNQREY